MKLINERQTKYIHLFVWNIKSKASKQTNNFIDKKKKLSKISTFFVHCVCVWVSDSGLFAWLNSNNKCLMLPNSQTYFGVINKLNWYRRRPLMRYDHWNVDLFMGACFFFIMVINLRWNTITVFCFFSLS